MSSQIQFTPVYGDKAFQPLCYLLEIDECKILLDCGWDSRFRIQDIEGLKKYDFSNNVFFTFLNLDWLTSMLCLYHTRT